MCILKYINVKSNNTQQILINNCNVKINALVQKAYFWDADVVYSQ